jgi:hypothetical protein
MSYARRREPEAMQRAWGRPGTSFAALTYVVFKEKA